MKKLFLLAIVQISGFSLLFSQIEPDSLWFQTYGGDNFDSASSVIQTSDGNYVFSGWTYSFGNGYDDVYLVKTDENGNELWAKTYGGSNHDRANSVIETSDNGFFITGFTYSFDSMLSAIYIIRTDENGDSLWTKTIDDVGYEFGFYGVQTSDENYVIVGKAYYPYSTRIILLIKINQFGDVIWTNYIGGNGINSLSGGACVQNTEDNGLIISGYTYSPNLNYGNAYLIKTNADGDTLWTKQYDGNGNSFGNYVQQTSDGGFVVTGYVESVEDNSDIYLIKTNVVGDTVWTKKFGGQFDCMGLCVQQTTDDGFVIAGSKHDWSDDSYNAFILKTNSFGDSMWSQSYGGNLAVANCIVSNEDNEYIVAGSTNSNLSPQQSDAFLLKLGYETNLENNINFSPFSLINHPNPFNPSTAIEFSIQNDSKIELSIYNMKGQKIKTLANNEFQKGQHSINWNGDDRLGKFVSSGIYYYKLKVNGKTEAVKKCLLLK